MLAALFLTLSFAADPECALGMLTIRAKPWADVYVDGVLTARGAHLATVDVSVGEHVVTFRNRAGKNVDVTVAVTAKRVAWLRKECRFATLTRRSRSKFRMALSRPRAKNLQAKIWR